MQVYHDTRYLKLQTRYNKSFNEAIKIPISLIRRKKNNTLRIKNHHKYTFLLYETKIIKSH